ncbi:hypothetical protein SDC9_176880 [bioreactor metagenome]|uniref:Uncharacterized protein n=1 Tax=bioreactor metagenome TaxID=1076179 RepID=A0A645GRA0_9ZZZZ
MHVIRRANRNGVNIVTMQDIPIIRDRLTAAVLIHSFFRPLRPNIAKINDFGAGIL